MKMGYFKKTACLLMTLVMLIGLLPQMTFAASAEEGDANPYKGKVVSILSASTSTFEGYVPIADGFNLEHRSRYPQSNLLTDVNETWWMQLINELDAKLGVNESWAGSQVLNNLDNNSGDLGPDAAMASLTRIQNLGSNGTPDLILFFGGGNDIGRSVPLGTFDPKTAPAEVDLAASKWNTFADAYAAAILRIKHYYPNAQILAMTTYAMPSYATAAKLDKYGSVIKAICEHYNVPYVDLRNSGITYDMLPDDIHPNAAGMDCITDSVLDTLLSECFVEPGENAVYSVTHNLNGAKASLGYYKGVSAGKDFTEKIEGEGITATITMGGKDITDSAYADGTINITNVTGDIVITATGAFNADGHLQKLPKGICAGTNLWTALEPENIYYTVNGWGNTASNDSWSITFPVKSGDRIWATSLGHVSTNGSSASGVRVTWFDENGVLVTLDRGTVYAEFAEHGYITAPEGAVALNLPMTHNQAHYAVYILSAGHNYENGNCTSCNARRPDLDTYQGKAISILGDSISTFSGVSNDASVNASLSGSSVYYSPGTLGVARSDPWWQQTIDALGLKLLVNNSWSGSAVLKTRSGTPGAYVNRCVQLHNDQTGEEPDIIAVFMGTNDFSYYQSTLGTADIDYAALIADKGDGTFAYAEPATTCEAYAILLHKMKVRYPDADIYCMTLTARRDPDKEDSYADVGQPTAFNAQLTKIIERFGCTAVDLETCGIDKDAEIFDTYMGDGRVHPNAVGMDKITKALLSTMLGQEAAIYNVSYDLENVLADTDRGTVLSDGTFGTRLTLPEDCDGLTVRVTMGGADITSSVYADGCVSIPAVTGDVVIAAAAVKAASNYRWEFDGKDLVSVGEAVNSLTRKAGSVTDGVLMDVYYGLAEKVQLRHDRPWTVEFRASGAWSGMLLSSEKTSSTAGNIYLFKTSTTSGLIGFGERVSNQYQNYGVALSAEGVDTTAEHTYRLENRLAGDGSNMVYLFVDGMEYGAMNNYFISGDNNQNTTADWLSGKDMRFAYIGASGHAMNRCAIEYLSVWEGGHSHTYESTITAPTCTEQGYTTYTCTCGDNYVEDYVARNEHSYNDGVCTVCGREEPNPYTGKTVACIGDSITYGVGVTRDRDDYVTVLAKALEMDYIRLGASGTTLCTDGHATCNIGKLTEENLAGADVVTVLMGINDFVQARNGYYTLGTIDSKDTSTIYGAAHMWCQKIEELRWKETLKDTEFYFMTPVITSWNNSVSSARNWDQSKANIHGYTLRDLCNAIIEVCALYDIPVIDLNLISGLYYNSAEDHNIDQFGGDGAHPGETGHRMMADAIRNVLLKNNLREDHDHSYGSWITTDYPDCDGGEQQRVCAVCTATERKMLDGKGHVYENGSCTVCGAAQTDLSAYKGKVISILGDSISTFAGYIPTADGFNLEHLARYPQDDLLTDVNETWWMQVIAELDAKLGINDSWRGATVSGAASVTTGTSGENAAMGNLTRIQNLGANGIPDVILFYGGTNDLAHVSRVGSFDAVTAPTEVDLTTKKWDNLADGYVHTLLRLQHYYPNAQIVALLPAVTTSYHSNEKLAQANAVLAEICMHYGVAYTDLRECGISTADLPDGIHPDAGGMDYITNAVLNVLMATDDMMAGENVVYPVTHELTNAEASRGYYKGVSAGMPFEETLSGDNLTVTVTMGGEDITGECYADGEIYIESVTGAVNVQAKAVFSLGERLQQIPKDVCAGTNLWTTLEHDKEYYTVNGWGVHASGNVYSVTIPVNPADQLWATSFQASGANGGTINGIRVTWFSESGVLESVSADRVYAEFAANGYLTVPENANAVNLVMWNGDERNEFYILNRPHTYENGMCACCGTSAPALEGKTLSILGASISTYAGASNGAAAETTNSNIRNNVKYYPNTTIPDVGLNDTWWMQVCNDLGLRLLVNNSWSGSALLHERSGTVGAYVDRCVQLHDDTGDNAGETPNIIGIQMGTNDFQYYKDTLGTADIDYATLITENADGSFIYAEPATSLEAAAIVLHKISVRYPGSEVYYLNVSQRVDGTDDLLRSFNAELEKVVEHFGAHIVDIYDSAITMDVFDTYIGDGHVHPNKFGMDAYAEAFKASVLANTNYSVTAHTVSFDLTNVSADYGTDKAVVAGERFSVNLTANAGNILEVTVTMGGKDITESAYADGTVTIAAVTDDVTITAKSVHTSRDYRWEFDGTDLVSVGETKNTLTRNAGTTTDGVFDKTRYALENAVYLLHDESWVVEWKSEGTFKNTSGSGARVFTSDDVNAHYNARYIFKSNVDWLIAMGEKTTTGSHNYGIALADYGIDGSAPHTYCLENRIMADGSNTIWLYVDGEEIGALNHYYIGTNDQKVTSDWLSGKDFVFPYMGTDTHGFTNCSIDYIAVWEAGHIHSYVSFETAPTCTEQGYTTYTCHCGDSYQGDYVSAIGHNYDDGVVTTAPGCESEGVKTFTCQNDSSHIYTEVVEAIGHKFSNYMSDGNATCETDGTKTAKCENCDATDTVADVGTKKEHTYTDDADAACNACGYVREIIPVKPDVGADVSADGRMLTVELAGAEELAAARFAVWVSGAQSETLVWVDAEDVNGVWTAEIPLCQFGRGGKLNIHAYDSGTMIDSVSVNIEEAEHSYSSSTDKTCDLCGHKREVESDSRYVVAMYRMYNPNTGEHFYTGSTEERENLVEAGWHYEGEGFRFRANDPDPVHRLFEPATGEHLYTMDEDEMEELLADGWEYEGVAFNSASSDEAPQYRLHNPNATVGAYHFTNSKVEKDNLIAAGWEYQGIGFYSLLR